MDCYCRLLCFSSRSGWTSWGQYTITPTPAPPPSLGSNSVSSASIPTKHPSKAFHAQSLRHEVCCLCSGTQQTAPHTAAASEHDDVLQEIGRGPRNVHPGLPAKQSGCMSSPRSCLEVRPDALLGVESLLRTSRKRPRD